MTTQDFHIDAIDYLMSDGKPRRCWLRGIDLRKVVRAVHERESRTFWQRIEHGFIACVGVFLP